MPQLIATLLTLATAWLLGRALAKWATQLSGVRMLVSIFTIMAFVFPKLLVATSSAFGDFPAPVLQMLLALASLWLGYECLYLLRQGKRHPVNARRIAKLLKGYTVFLLLLLALHPLALDLAATARLNDGNSNGDSLPMVLSLFAAWHLIFIALAGALAQWHGGRGKLSWRVLLPFANA